MNDMISFSVAMMGAVADFLTTPPIIYLFGLVCFVFLCKALKILMFR